ncbi:Venom allergen 3 [Diplodia seriata]|uniref:Venom allergen 3 n=1 Tax=Diplodia seriata TaxID=420778 RepID=A0A1S8BE83_9PEZI|nr:Venom allergen 3 [Diplodia seriata]
MRSSALIAASLASGALAVPMLNKRGVAVTAPAPAVVTDLDIVTVTKYVTATGPCPTTGVTNTVAVTQEAVTSSMVEVTSYTSAAAAETTPAVVVPAPVSSVAATVSSVVESIGSVVESVATSIYVAPTSAAVTSATYEAPSTTEAATSSTPAPSTTEAASSSAAGGFSTYSFCPTASVVSTASLTAQPTGTVQKKWLAYHNAHRANHTDGCSMYWDYDLEAKAQDSANTCVYEHTVSSTDNFGQNMGQFEYTTSGLGTVNDTTMENSPGFFMNMYYEEYNDFGPYWGVESVPTDGPNILHFTQMIWKQSFSVGCATAKCSNDQQMITFCNYRSRGMLALPMRTMPFLLTVCQATSLLSTPRTSPTSSPAPTSRSALRSAPTPPMAAASPMPSWVSK